MVYPGMKRETDDLGCMHRVGVHAEGRKAEDLGNLDVFSVLSKIPGDHAALTIPGGGSTTDDIPIVIRIQGNIENAVFRSSAIGSGAWRFRVELRPLGRAHHRVCDCVAVQSFDEVHAFDFVERVALVVEAVVELSQRKTGRRNIRGRLQAVIGR